MDLANAGKWMVAAGLLLAGAGAMLWLAAKLGLPIGALPGDIRLETGRVSFRFPVVTCILLSILITLALNLLGRFFGKLSPFEADRIRGGHGFAPRLDGGDPAWYKGSGELIPSCGTGDMT